MSIKVEIDMRELLELVNETRRRALSMKRAFTLIGRYMLKEFAVAHREKRSAAGQIWPPNKGAPPGRRFPDGSGEQMVDTGRLRKGFFVTSNENVFMVADQQVEIGTQVPYYIHHHFGAPKANLPMRRVIDWDEEKHGPELVEVVANYLFGKRR
jgi:phage gpG-like protein